MTTNIWDDIRYPKARELAIRSMHLEFGLLVSDALSIVQYAERLGYPWNQWYHSLLYGGPDRLEYDTWVYFAFYHGDKLATWPVDPDFAG